MVTQHALRESDGLHQSGEKLHFSIAPTDTEQKLNALTLFNLGGNGELNSKLVISN